MIKGMPSFAKATAEAAEDLRARSLSHIDPLIGQLVFVASTRDYNSGEYSHEGLASRYGFEAAREALSQVHEAIFQDVLKLKLADLSTDLERYLQAGDADAGQMLRSWQSLKAYQLLPPADSDAISMALFCSNMKIALALLHLRRAGDSSRQELH